MRNKGVMAAATAIAVVGGISVFAASTSDTPSAPVASASDTLSGASTYRPLISGHRGTRVGAPEDTLSAFRYAKQAGADIIEFDVFWSSDGKMVVMHDTTMGRTSDCTGNITSHTWKYISACDVGSWLDPKWVGERVPSFEQVLSWAKANNMRINPEIKGNQQKGDDPKADTITAAQAKQFVAAIKTAGMEDKTVVSADSHAVIRSIQATKAPVVTADIAMEAPVSKTEIASYGKAYMPTWQLFSAGNVATLDKLGVQVYLWPVRNEAEMQEAYNRRGDVLVVDDPKAMVAWLANR
jgi:glycerophosphoryl diester phosphodiesterase